MKSKDLTWKFIFFMMKYLHIFALICLFINGAENLNSFRNLGFMMFFIVYTTNEWLYRKTSSILSIFISFFIIG